jgi:hypothetical protein
MPPFSISSSAFDPVVIITIVSRVRW